MIHRFKGFGKDEWEELDDGFANEEELRAACRKLKKKYQDEYKKRYGFLPQLGGVVGNSIIKNLLKNMKADNVQNIDAIVEMFINANDVPGHSLKLLQYRLAHYMGMCFLLRAGDFERLYEITKDWNYINRFREALGIEKDYSAGVDENGHLID